MTENLDEVYDAYLEAKAEFEEIRDEAFAEFFSPMFQTMLAGAAQAAPGSVLDQLSPQQRQVFKEVLGKDISEVIGGNKDASESVVFS